MDDTKIIRSFKDLIVYQNSYKAMILVMTKIVPALPKCEDYDLKDQLRRTSKSVPRLIAEGYAKRHQRAGFQKYLDDAMGECNEMVVNLEECRDVYAQFVELSQCEELFKTYDITGRQLYKLSMKWHHFKRRDGFANQAPGPT